MENEDQKYCVAAYVRSESKRRAITGPLSKKDASIRQKDFLSSYRDKKYLKYFHVAKYPYKSK